ncbi:MAG TPA: pirin family protein [Gammaproteobacteria bacterium]
MPARQLEQLLESRPTSDGAGVKLRRVVSPEGMRRLDPFLLLDEFGSDSADDYVGGFPAHPHRGFETVTYMLEGRMRHEDHLGNVGHLVSGGVQWMTAGRGVIHSEMPEQEAGRMRGFQLWINLPAAEKMGEPGYRDIPPEAIPTLALDGGITVKVIAGRFAHAGGEVAGAVEKVATAPLYLDLQLPGGGALEVPVPAGHTALAYVYDGAVEVAGRGVPAQQLAILGDGDAVTLQGGAGGGRALLLAARPLGEPVAHYGPFVMNTRAEIEQALADYRAGRLTG